MMEVVIEGVRRIHLNYLNDELYSHEAYCLEDMNYEYVLSSIGSSTIANLERDSLS
jgi:hypothetical protein